MADVKGQTREDRLKAALRENLKRRKTQARGRSASEEEPGAAGRDAQGSPGKTKDPAG